MDKENKKLQLCVSVTDGPDDFSIFMNLPDMGTHHRVDYKDFNLPEELITRFKFWQNWHDKCVHEKRSEIDWRAFDSYGIALTIDLKLFLGNEYHISYYVPCLSERAEMENEVEIIIESPQNFPQIK